VAEPDRGHAADRGHAPDDLPDLDRKLPRCRIHVAGQATAAIDPDGVLASLFGPFLDQPRRSALVTDFDGTLAPIVADPAAARPLAGAAGVLTRLARQLGLVAVVSGRPVATLAEHLGQVPGLEMVGLYGLERRTPDGAIAVCEGAEEWRSVVGQVARRLTAQAPAGVGVEPKGLTLTLHWRQAPTERTWVQRLAAEAAAETGLVLHPGRMTVELRPPLAVDKGTAVTEIVGALPGAAYLGDDLGDLPAFAALDALARTGACSTINVAVADPESPDELLAAADVVTDGPPGALRLLEWLAQALPTGTG